MRTSVLAVVGLVACPAWAVGLQTAAPDADVAQAQLKAVEQAIEEFGKPAVIDYLIAVRHGRITIEVDGAFRSSVGRPNQKFLTAASVLRDLALAKVDPLTLKDELAKRGATVRDSTITQADVTSGRAASDRSAGSPPAKGWKDSLPQDNCYQATRRIGEQAAAGKGCKSPQATGVELFQSGDSSVHPRYMVRGTCAADDGTTGSFETIVKCFVSPIPGSLQVEGSGRAVSQTDMAPVSCTVTPGGQ